MPIKPENRHLYPGGSTTSPEWKAIRARILERAGGKCERCGVPNYALGGRRRCGSFHPALPKGERLLRREWPEPGEWWWCEGFGEQLRIIRIVLTIAHLDHDPGNSDDENLQALCQRCHNRHDAEHRRANAAATRRARQAVADLLRP